MTSSNPKEGVSIITSTIRKSFIHNLFQNYNRQQWPVKELIIIVNKNNIKLHSYRKLAARYNQVRIYRMDESYNLGACLNYGASLAKYDYIAKFDDDDYYSPYYLEEAMALFTAKDADVVGKRTTYFYFPHRSKLLLRRASIKAGCPSTIIAGPTIMFHKRIFKKVSFSPNIQQGSDVHFIKSCLRKGARIYTTTSYNFVSIRRANRYSHTWKISDKQLLSHRRAVVIDTKDYKSFITKPI